MSNEFNASSSNAITYSNSQKSSSGFSSYALLNDVLGDKNADNLKLLYERYDFIPKNSFLTSLKTKNPIVRSGEKSPKIYLEMDLEEEIRMISLPQANQLEVFLRRSDKEKMGNRKESQERFNQKLMEIANEKKYRMDEIIMPSEDNTTNSSFSIVEQNLSQTVQKLKSQKTSKRSSKKSYSRKTPDKRSQSIKKYRISSHSRSYSHGSKRSKSVKKSREPGSFKLHWQHNFNILEKNKLLQGVNTIIGKEELQLDKQIRKARDRSDIDINFSGKGFWKKKSAKKNIFTKDVMDRKKRNIKRMKNVEKMKKNQLKFKQKKGMRKIEFKLSNGMKGEANQIWKEKLYKHPEYIKLKNQMIDDDEAKEDKINFLINKEIKDSITQLSNIGVNDDYEQSKKTNKFNIDFKSGKKSRVENFMVMTKMSINKKLKSLNNAKNINDNVNCKKSFLFFLVFIFGNRLKKKKETFKERQEREINKRALEAERKIMEFKKELGMFTDNDLYEDEYSGIGEEDEDSLQITDDEASTGRKGKKKAAVVKDDEDSISIFGDDAEASRDLSIYSVDDIAKHIYDIDAGVSLDSLYNFH